MHSTLFGAGFANTYDSYLSPFSYKGVDARIIRQTERRTHMMHDRVNYQTLLDVDFQYTRNPGRNIHGYSGGVRYSNAWLYSFLGSNTDTYGHNIKNAKSSPLEVLGGIGATGYLGGIYNGRSGSNNPAQAKADIMLDAVGQVRYTFHVSNHPWLVRYQVNIPLMGLAFSPQYGQSYYEIFVGGNYDHNTVFASFVNMPSMRHLLTLDIPIGRNNVRIGWSGSFMQSTFNGIRYHSYSNTFLIGFTKYFKRM